jgi:hypothetical protein
LANGSVSLPRTSKRTCGFRGDVSRRGRCLGAPFPMKRKCRFFFLVNTTDARVLHRFSDPVTPWPSCQRSPAAQKRLHPPSKARVASRCAASRRISCCGAFAFFLLPSQSQALDKFLAETARRRRPEMAPQRLEKIESAPGNGMASEVSKPQHLVHGRAADRALRPGAARTLSNTTRGAGRKFSALQSIEIARNREGISEASPARRTDRRSSRAASPAPARRSR